LSGQAKVPIFHFESKLIARKMLIGHEHLMTLIDARGIEVPIHCLMRFCRHVQNNNNDWAINSCYHQSY